MEMEAGRSRNTSVGEFFDDPQGIVHPAVLSLCQLITSKGEGHGIVSRGESAAIGFGQRRDGQISPHGQCCGEYQSSVVVGVVAN